MWTRIFGRTDSEPPLADMLQKLTAANFPLKANFKGDDLGWTGGELHFGNGTPVMLERYLAKEDGIRADLNTWAAWLETADYSPFSKDLMEKVIQSQQLITIRKPIDNADDSKLDDLLVVLRQWLAHAVEGIVQVDGLGWLDAQGIVLVQEY